MRRKSKNTPSYWDWEGYTVLDAVDPEQLRLIGAICLEWNFIEDTLDFVFFNAIEVWWELSVEISSRINGLDGKVEIIKRAARIAKCLPDDVYNTVAQTLGAFTEYKRYRDGVVHVRLLNPKLEVAPTSIKRGAADEVIISKPALERLYTGLNILADEMSTLHQVLAFHLTREGGPPDYRDVFDTTPREPLEQFRAYVALLREHQKRRLSLPPLPKFPESPQAPPSSEAEQ
jgi:hypothetical protein